MKNSIERLLSKENLTSEDIENVVVFLEKALTSARKREKIDIHTYLEIGTISTSLRLVARMMQHWNLKVRYKPAQIKEELEKIRERVSEIEQKYPEIDEIVGEYRKRPEMKKKKRYREVRFRVEKRKKRGKSRNIGGVSGGLRKIK